MKRELNARQLNSRDRKEVTYVEQEESEDSEEREKPAKKCAPPAKFAPVPKSDYELERDANCAQNDTKLFELGLKDKPMDPKPEKPAQKGRAKEKAGASSAHQDEEDAYVQDEEEEEEESGSEANGSEDDDSDDDSEAFKKKQAKEKAKFKKEREARRGKAPSSRKASVKNGVENRIEKPTSQYPLYLQFINANLYINMSSVKSAEKKIVRELNTLKRKLAGGKSEKKVKPKKLSQAEEEKIAKKKVQSIQVFWTNRYLNRTLALL
ncbi:hypothetical protein T492DRAFT_838039 [Pavlovales sp. CCMP2436]|nr:hypothetical protein T492DRAFT_838039 [Pavlovales sp. CCMP2436]